MVLRGSNGLAGLFNLLQLFLQISRLTFTLSLDWCKIICAKLSSPRFILEGVVAPELQKFSTSLLSNPLIMVKSWSNLQVRIGLHLCS